MNAYLLLGAAALILFLALALPEPAGGGNSQRVVAFIMAPILVAAALTFGRLVVTFDGRGIVLRYGIFTKKIGVEKIVSLEPAEIKWWRFGGTGIRMGRGVRGWVAGSGPGVKIETAGGPTYVANCEQPERLVALVEDFLRARRA